MNLASTLKTENRRTPWLIIGLVVLIAVLWTVVESLPALMTTRYSLYEIVWLRYAGHLLAMVVLLGPRRVFASLQTKRLPLQIGRGVLMLVMPISFILGIERMSVHDVLAIFWLCPLWILGFAALVERETVSWQAWLIGIAAIIAGQLILRPDRDTLHSTAVFALLMGLSFGLYVVLTRVLRTEPHQTSLFFTAACVFVPLTFVMPFVWHTPALQDIVIMATISVAGLGLLWALDFVCERTPARMLAFFMPFQLVIGVLLPLLLGNAGVGKLTWVGCALIVGIVIVGLSLRSNPSLKSSDSLPERVDDQMNDKAEPANAHHG